MTILRRAVEAETTVTPAFAPRRSEWLMRMKGDLRLGLPVVLTGGTGGGPAQLVFALETLTEDRFAAARLAGPAVLVLTPVRAGALSLAVPPGARAVCLPAAGLALDRLRALADPVAPVAALPPGPGLCAVAGDAAQAAAIALAKEAQLLPALLTVALADGAAFARDNGLAVMQAGALVEEAARLSPHLPVSSARVPMAVSQAGRVHVFRPDDGGQEHYAIEIGAPDPAGPVLVRLHSACFTGDVLGSLKCDCGPQLQAAMQAMAQAGGGVLLYLNQEGRGIGLANKMRAYALQDRGMDTVEANHHLGFDDDERDFRIGAQMLARLGIRQVRLMTNNPAKLAMLAAHGLRVADRVPLQVGRNAQNAHYLATKARRSGHLLS